MSEDKIERFVPPTTVEVTADQIKGLTVGQNVTVEVAGLLDGIHKIEDSNRFVLGVKPAAAISIKTNAADKAIKEMATLEIMNEADRGFEQLEEK